MRSSWDYAGFAQLCARSPIMRKIMRADNRIIQRSLRSTDRRGLALPAHTAAISRQLSRSASSVRRIAR